MGRDSPTGRRGGGSAAGGSAGRRLVDRLRAGAGVVVLAVVVTAVTALVASLLQTPVYEATARIVVGPNPEVPGSVAQAPGRGLAETEIQLLLSPAVKAVVRERLGRAPGVSASPVGQAAAFDVTAESTRAAQAAGVANAYATAYVGVRLRQAVDAIGAGAGAIESKASTLQRQLDALPPGDSARQSLTAQIIQLKSSQDRLQVAAAALAGGTQVVRPAVAPAHPTRPDTVRNVALAALAGLVLGLAVALTASGRREDALSSQDDLEGAAPGVVVLGVVPAGPSAVGPPVLADAASAAGQAYRLVGSSLRFRSLDRPLRLVAVTSAVGGEGATTAAANLALAVARAGQRVVFVGCDPRGPARPSPFGVPDAVGLTSVVSGEAPISATLQGVVTQAGLQAMSVGPPRGEASDLLSSPRLTDVFRALGAQADIVILDCPPVGSVDEASPLLTSVDGTVLVASTWASTRRGVRQAVARLEGGVAPLVGVVLIDDRRLPDQAAAGVELPEPAAEPARAPESQSG